MSTDSSINDNLMSAKQWQNGNKNQETDYFHFSKILCVKYVRIRRFSGPYFRAFVQNTEILIFNPNAVKCGPEKLLIRTLFTPWLCAVIFSESPLSLRVWEKKKTKTTHESIFQPMNFQNRSSATKYQPSSNLSIESSFRSS